MDSLEGKVESRDDYGGEGTEDEDANLSRGHESSAAPESVVARELLVLSQGHDELVLSLDHGQRMNQGPTVLLQAIAREKCETDDLQSLLRAWSLGYLHNVWFSLTKVVLACCRSRSAVSIAGLATYEAQRQHKEWRICGGELWKTLS